MQQFDIGFQRQDLVHVELIMDRFVPIRPVTAPRVARGTPIHQALRFHGRLPVRPRLLPDALHEPLLFPGDEPPRPPREMLVPDLVVMLAPLGATVDPPLGREPTEPELP